MHWTGKALLGVISAFAILYALAYAAAALPWWGMPAARLWYATGFSEAVTTELAKLPGSENACIYDDSQNLFVTSPEQLNVDKMLRRALVDRAPRLRRNRRWRDPHFRVYAGGRTYYWSFRERKFHGFYADRWTLAGTAEKSCKNYRQSPHLIREAFRSREGIAVTEENFCCGIEDPQP
ncbi:MAG: hypothetical protein QNJ14_17710 [Woeseiaceae bacterium]|nr:hypothetical protein [Woeseiaceae bacterium]